MQTPTTNPNALWTFADLALFLQVSESKLRHDVMEGEIPCIRIGRSVRFDKNQIEKHFNIEIPKGKEIEKEEEKPSVKPVFNRGPLRDLMVETITWLREKATILPYSEIDIRLIIHEGRIKRVERTIVEKLQEP
ncbi:MAG TPA: helix-turn-helix domain-containing protein [Bacteroidales bacterium]|nr:helix-turn-helix domain-containing protein [Bacteroidales bacterium]